MEYPISVGKIEFKADLVLEYSLIPSQIDIGEFNNSMELIMQDQLQGNIEWIYTKSSDSKLEDVTQIGVWFNENKTLIDYDGVFSLPIESIQLIRKCGYIVPEDFEN